MEQLEGLLTTMSSLSLEEMKTVKLMNRTDTKYLLSKQDLYRLAERWPDYFGVQQIDGHRMAHYRTLYFDTADAFLYTIHHNRKLTRQKVRQREYLDTGEMFCEVKSKNNQGRTRKKRISIHREEWGSLSSPEQETFLQQRFWTTTEPLSSRLQNQFSRITLVNSARTERITVDADVDFVNVKYGTKASAGDLVIVEVKQDGRQSSDFKRLLFEARIPEKRISKYCLGMLLTDPQIKYNRFKEKIHYINRIVENPLTIQSLIQF